MLGSNLFKIESSFELSSERLKSLVFFYEPIIGEKALFVYEYCTLKNPSIGFSELNDLLSTINISIDEFEHILSKLNEVKLLKTLNKENKYIFVFSNPEKIKNFIKDDLLVRSLINKTSVSYYQKLISDVLVEDKHSEYQDVSATMELPVLDKKDNPNESYIVKKDESYNFNTYFDINVFLKDISKNLLPMSFRSKENLYEVANLADLYNISYDQMRQFIPRVFNNETNTFDSKLLAYLCMKAKCDYKKVENDNYNVPCKLYLMSLQEGKEVSEYDNRILYKLANDYHLAIPVINVVLEHALKNCDNRLIEKYVYALASDLHRNNINSSSQALIRLDKYNGSLSKTNSKAKPISYDTSKNNNLSNEELDALLALRGKQ